MEAQNLCSQLSQSIQNSNFEQSFETLLLLVNKRIQVKMTPNAVQQFQSLDLTSPNLFQIFQKNEEQWKNEFENKVHIFETTQFNPIIGLPNCQYNIPVQKQQQFQKPQMPHTNPNPIINQQNKTIPQQAQQGGYQNQQQQKQMNHQAQNQSSTQMQKMQQSTNKTQNSGIQWKPNSVINQNQSNNIQQKPNQQQSQQQPNLNPTRQNFNQQQQNPFNPNIQQQSKQMSLKPNLKSQQQDNLVEQFPAIPEQKNQYQNQQKLPGTGTGRITEQEKKQLRDQLFGLEEQEYTRVFSKAVSFQDAQQQLQELIENLI